MHMTSVLESIIGQLKLSAAQTKANFDKTKGSTDAPSSPADWNLERPDGPGGPGGPGNRNRRPPPKRVVKLDAVSPSKVVAAKPKKKM